VTKWFGHRASARFAAVGAVCFVVIAGAGRANAQSTSPDEGLRIFKSANCVGCHKWSGEGGGGYGGAAANLRQTMLSPEQIEETVRCGRPMTGMPHFEADAYADGHCYGVKQADLSDGKMPPAPDHPLRPAEIRMVATYVVMSIKGQGDPNLAQCLAFFGTGSRVCDIYAKQGGAEGHVAATSPEPAASASHERMKVDSAADANAASKSPGK
jgi:mono/diheme cytochrome c family protein